ncbi:MAG: hypothetical protein IJ566_06795 [Cardiobacteriaceae bacterium]|nr:hypothetical protein [Cardiobacteriaceae bacterium]
MTDEKLIYKELEEYSERECLIIIKSGDKNQIEDMIYSIGLYSDNMKFVEDIIEKTMFLFDGHLLISSINTLAHLARRFDGFDLNKWLNVLNQIPDIQAKKQYMGIIEDLIYTYELRNRVRISSKIVLKTKKKGRVFRIYFNKYECPKRRIEIEMNKYDYSLYSYKARKRMKKIKLREEYYDMSDLEQLLKWCKEDFNINKEDWELCN